MGTELTWCLTGDDGCQVQITEHPDQCAHCGQGVGAFVVHVTGHGASTVVEWWHPGCAIPKPDWVVQPWVDARPPAAERLSSGAELIAAERVRQQEVEGYTPEHDAMHDHEELMAAAGCYLEAARAVEGIRSLAPGMRATGDPRSVALADEIEANPAAYLYRRSDGGEGLRPPNTWPWEREAWKPAPDRVRNLVKAGALIAAQIDALNAEREER